MKERPIYTSDTQIVQGIRNNDDRALSILYKNNYNYIEQYIRKNSGNESDAKDIYQEAVTVLYNKIIDPSFELTSSIRTYLYSVSRNLWLKHLNRKKRITVVPLSDQEKVTASEVSVLEQEMQFEEREAAAKQAMEDISDQCAAILRNFYILKKSLEDIAKEFSLSSTKAAKQKRWTCMKQLRKLVFTRLNI